MRGFTSTAWRYIRVHKKINLTKLEKIFKKVLTIILRCGKINTVKEIRKAVPQLPTNETTIHPNT